MRSCHFLGKVPLALHPLKYSTPLRTPVLSLPWLIFRSYTCNMYVHLPLPLKKLTLLRSQLASTVLDSCFTNRPNCHDILFIICSNLCSMLWQFNMQLNESAGTTTLSSLLQDMLRHGVLRPSYLQSSVIEWTANSRILQSSSTTSNPCYKVKAMAFGCS